MPLSAEDVRLACRGGFLTGPTAGLGRGAVQAHLIALPRDWALEFFLFCQRNPKPCPLLDVTDPGSAVPTLAAPGADLRTDLPGYRVYEHGELVAEPDDLLDHWTGDLVAFLVGCSFGAEDALRLAGIPVPPSPPVYRTGVECLPGGRFRANLSASMIPLRPSDIVRATEICSRLPMGHGTPVYFGDPAGLGVLDTSSPDAGEAVAVGAGEVPAFWASAATALGAALAARPPLLVTHKPGHLFVTDRHE